MTLPSLNLVSYVSRSFTPSRNFSLQSDVSKVAQPVVTYPDRSPISDMASDISFPPANLITVSRCTSYAKGVLRARRPFDMAWPFISSRLQRLLGPDYAWAGVTYGQPLARKSFHFSRNSLQTVQERRQPYRGSYILAVPRYGFVTFCAGEVIESVLVVDKTNREEIENETADGIENKTIA